jgi:hypothetical protein
MALSPEPAREVAPMSEKKIKVRARAVKTILVSRQVDKKGILLTLYLSDWTDFDLAISRAVAVRLLSQLRSTLEVADQELKGA